MVKSMTGYGRGEFSDNEKNWSVEIKSVNNRFLDINVKIPRKYSLLEEKIRALVKKYISRGRIDIYIKCEDISESLKSVNLDKGLAKNYYNSLRELAQMLNVPFNADIIEIASLPEVIKIEEPQEDLEKIWPSLKEALTEALHEVLKMREIEGRELANDLLKRANIIKRNVEEIEKMVPNIVEEYREKLRARVNELLLDVEIPEERLAIEVAILADKSNITEEIVRLFSHLKQFEEIINLEEAIGRKLDFLVQEMNREVNTIGSKSNNGDISNIVVSIKSELEKIREQIQNIE